MSTHCVPKRNSAVCRLIDLYTDGFLADAVSVLWVAVSAVRIFVGSVRMLVGPILRDINQYTQI